MSPHQTPQKSGGGTETILFAEDESAVRRMTERVLTRAGYNVIVAENGERAVDCFKENADAIKLLVLDAVMPELGGIETCERIRGIRPEVPTLFCSGYSADFATDGVGLPENSTLLQKPYGLDELLVRIRQLLDR